MSLQTSVTAAKLVDKLMKRTGGGGVWASQARNKERWEEEEHSIGRDVVP